MRGWLVAAALAIVLAGCGSAELTANPNLTPAPLAVGWQYKSWSDPGLQMGLPSDWLASDATQTSDPGAFASMAPELQKYMEWSNMMGSTGKTRLSANGKLETPLGSLDSGYVSVYVESGDQSLSAFADRVAQLNKGFGATSVDRTTVVVPPGPAARLALSGQFDDPSTKYSEVDYLFILPDGRSLTVAIGGTGSAAVSSAVSDFASRVIATLSPTH